MSALGPIAGLLLLAHAFVHLRVWVWGLSPAASSGAHRSWLIGEARGVTTVLAVVSSALLGVAGAGIMARQDWGAYLALAGGVASTLLLLLVFNRWLLLGLALNAIVIALALRAIAA